jgi:hypothetical protein
MSRSRIKQHGLIGILLLVTIAVMAVAVFSKNIWGDDSRTYQQKVNREALKQAKAALLDYIEVGPVSDLTTAANVFVATNGRLPCPNQNGDGRSVVPCGTNAGGNGVGVHSLGLLPWATLGLPVIRDASRQCLWYAVDGLYKNSTLSPSVNSDSQASFSVVQPKKVIDPVTKAISWLDNLMAGNVNGIASNDRVVAVIIAPGAAGGTQTQASVAAGVPCLLTTQFAGAFNAEASASNFLKYYSSTALNIINNQSVGLLGANTGTPATVNPVANASLKTFLTADTGQEQLNDQMIWITAEEFSKAATKRTARLYASAINSYVNSNGFYPPAASVPGGACVVGLLQGYAPYSCAKRSGATLTVPQQTLDFYLGTRLYNSAPASNDPDWWGAQTHYAVSQDCIDTGVTATRGTVAVYSGTFFLQITTPANPCRARTARVNLGAGTSGPPAIILMRGRIRASQASCTLFGGNGVAVYTGSTATAPVPPAVPNIAGCLEDPSNQSTVNAAFTAPLVSPANIFTANVSTGYRIPQAGSSNDYMVRFTTQ